MGYRGKWLPMTIGVVAVVQPAAAKTPAEIEAISQASKVKIEHIEDSNWIGSGVIVHKQG
jgi:hypothetical protein